MTYEWHLEQQARKGGLKRLLVRVEDGSNVIYREWGLVGKKQQSQTKEVQGKNIGKANETSAHEQAVIEAKAIVTRKMREGYREAGNTQAQEESQNFQFYPLPSNFAPSKPHNDPPTGVSFSGGYDGYFWERKNNGVNLLSITDLDGKKYDYSRGIKELTHVVSDIPVIKEFKEIETAPGSIISYELVYYNAQGREVPKELRGILNERTTPEKALARYNKLLNAGGAFRIKVFDTLYYDGILQTDRDYADRRAILQRVYWDSYPKYMSLYGDTLNKKIIDYAFRNHWEGFVLRKLRGPESHVEFTMNGKPHRKGAWKFKFQYTSDFVIYEAKVGDSGRLLGKLAHFHLGAYDDDGNLVEVCWAGPGNIKSEDLDEVARILSVDPTTMEPGKAYQTTLVSAEVKYSARQVDTNALEHPVLREIREDKPVSECLLSEERLAA